MKNPGLSLSVLGLALLALSPPGTGIGQSMVEAAKQEFNKSARGPCLLNQACFRVSNDYPSAIPKPEPLPFSAIDYKKDPHAYLAAVLAYVVEGNIVIDWDVARNPIRTWYHAPWMHPGRESIHGLTSERGSRWHELSGTQARRTRNWAVGFYNALGGYTIGRVWQDRSQPNSKGAIFPVGTVTAKLLFTDATKAEAPYLYSAPNLVWKADIDATGTPAALRLLQMDIAVKTDSADSHGWVFGTFVFDGSKGKVNYWENLIPVGLEWGNSPSFDYPGFANGGIPVESLVDSNAMAMFRGRAPDQRLGYLGRMNGPVDSPLSSCLSCHSRALDSRGRSAPDFTPSDTALCIQRIPLETEKNETYRRMSNCTVDEKLVAFYTRNLRSDEPFVPGFNSLDYSLQLALGISQWHTWYSNAYPAEYAKEFPPETMENMLRDLKSGERKLQLEMESVPMVPADQAFHRGD